MKKITPLVLCLTILLSGCTLLPAEHTITATTVPQETTQAVTTVPA